jgi:hypothetical protein
MIQTVPLTLVERLKRGDYAPAVLPDDSGVLLDIDGHQVLSLSKSAVVLVLQIQSGIDDLDELARALESRFDVALPRARADVDEFVGELSRILCVAV